VLLMDEPTNHLDIESIIWLEQFLKSFEGALLMTSHDREFMNRIVSKIAEIDAGEIVTYSGNYDFYERERAIRETNQQAAFARQQAMLAKEQRFIDRFKTHAAKAAQVQSRIKALDKIEKIELPKKRQVVKFDFRVPPRSGDQVAVIEDLHKSYGPRVIYDGFSLTIRRGERWAVMGRNGAGKTTLLKMIAGRERARCGSVRLGASLNMGYFAQQSLDVLDPDLTVIEQLQNDFPQDGLGSLRSLAGAFQFSGDDVDKKIRSLSGGEKSRLAMARMLYNPPNFLVLDEPTNHLDLATKEMLVEALKDFEGTMIFVSHDRTCSCAAWARACWNWAARAARIAIRASIPGSYVEYVQNDRFPRHGADLRQGGRIERPFRSRAVPHRPHQRRSVVSAPARRNAHPPADGSRAGAVAGHRLLSRRGGDAALGLVERDRCAPEDFYSTSNHHTFVRINGDFIEVQNQRMDAMIVVKDAPAQER
jgi:ATPase subunit of ABC transporter with duplicated ATPase domains